MLRLLIIICCLVAGSEQSLYAQVNLSPKGNCNAVNVKIFPVPLDSAWTYINYSGAIIDSSQIFEAASQSIFYDKLIVKQEGKWGVIDTSFTLKLEFQYDTIYLHNCNLIAKSETGIELYNNKLQKLYGGLLDAMNPYKDKYFKNFVCYNKKSS